MTTAAALFLKQGMCIYWRLKTAFRERGGIVERPVTMKIRIKDTTAMVAEAQRGREASGDGLRHHQFPKEATPEKLTIYERRSPGFPEPIGAANIVSATEK